MNRIEQQRLEFIDIAKGIGIICVVSGHLVGEGGISFKGSLGLQRLIYRFHMPLFMVISGILLFNSLKGQDSSKQFVNKKINKAIHSLLKPYIFWSAIYFVISDINQSQSVMSWIPYIFLFRGIAPVWFLAALFWAEMTSFLILFIFKTKKIMAVFILLFSATFLFSIQEYPCENIWIEFLIVTIGRNFVCTFFVLLGWYLSNYFRSIKTIKDIVILSGVVLILILSEFLRIEGCNLHLFLLGNIIGFFVFGTAGTFVIIILAKILEISWGGGKIIQKTGTKFTWNNAVTLSSLSFYAIWCLNM